LVESVQNYFVIVLNTIDMVILLNNIFFGVLELGVFPLKLPQSGIAAIQSGLQYGISIYHYYLIIVVFTNKGPPATNKRVPLGS
jgi:hypothetical protein